MPEPKPEPERCAICLDTYKGKKVVKVACQYCPEGACRACQQDFLLQSFEDPHCYACKRGWSPEFLAANFPLSFRNDTLRKHRRRVLREREKALLPAMQVYVGYKREQERLKPEIDALRKLVREGDDCVMARYNEASKQANSAAADLVQARATVNLLKHELETQVPPGDSARRTDVLKRLTAAREEREAQKEKYATTHAAFTAAQATYRELSGPLNKMEREFWVLQARYDDRYAAGDGGAAREERREFIMKCPAEDCRGFLSTAYKCGTCAKQTCSKCMVVLGEGDHICKKEDVETAKEIKDTTRPCPKCGTRIFKTEGCDQMFCTMRDCNTAFSWTTGKIETGRVHNPHYYEWLRRTGGGQAPREAGDIPCGGLPGAWQFIGAAELATGYLDRREGMRLLEIHRNVNEMIEWRLRDYPAQPRAGMNKEIDVQYLMNKISEEEWQRQLEFAEARFRRKRDIGQILNMGVTVCSELLQRVVNQAEALGGDHGDQIGGWLKDTLIPELDQLRDFVNQSLKDLAKREHMAVPQLAADWKWMPIRALYKAPKGCVSTGVGLVGPADPTDAVNEIVDIQV
jgi:hypothetical protein